MIGKLLVDSHAHLDLPDFDADRDEVLGRARQLGVSTIINVGLDLESSQASLEMAQSYSEVSVAVGFHPNHASLMKAGDLSLLTELAANPKVVAIGEIGLDFYRRAVSHSQQIEVFQQQLDLAAGLGLPVVIHCRQAHEEMLEILARCVKSPSINHKRGVIHCFSGNLKQARRYLEFGFLLSVAASVTYPSAHRLVEVVHELSLDKLLVETDAPFLAPQLHRGRRNEPAYVSLVVDRIAQIKGMPAETIAKATTQNALELFRLQ